MRLLGLVSGGIRRIASIICPALFSIWLLAAVGCGEEGESPIGPEAAAPPGVPGLVAAATAGALAFRQVSAGGDHNTCGVTTDNRAYCWGSSAFGLGDGATFQSERPVAVAFGLPFRQVSSGLHHTCGVTTDDRGYCWGRNDDGELGDGTTISRSTPVPVGGGLRFRQLEAGGFHTCGLTTDNRAYCWGFNSSGQIGDGSTIGRLKPRAVAGGRLWRQLDTGFLHSCGVTTSHQAFCWGSNGSGQLGDGSISGNRRLFPFAVAGGRQFRQISAGWSHTCGVTTGSRAFCWGGGSVGEIGDGKSIRQRREPRAVAGGLSFDRVTAGVFHTCGETTANLAYCWGSNTYGAVGDGTSLNNRLTPVPVTGGLHFSQVSAGAFYTCGVTPASVAYCWGYNFGGELGDGTTQNRSAPVGVVGP